MRLCRSGVYRLTGDIEVENIIIIGRIINQLPASLVHDQDFPLQTATVSSVIHPSIL
jgi:hypothetical protein